MSNPISSDYDIIFAGGGLAGLSLAWHIEESFPGKYRILIVEKENKSTNDRTWCFWEKANGPFEDAVLKKWNQLKVKGSDWDLNLLIKPYQYKMIRSSDFYKLVYKKLNNKQNVLFVNDTIVSLEDTAYGALLVAKEKKYKARWIFNSALRPKIPESHPRQLFQHFMGYFIRTNKNYFNPARPYFMDFSPIQESDVRFGYVLPTSENEALVEFTVFGNQIWTTHQYREALHKYLSNNLNIEEFEVIEEEFGIIPMTDYHPSKKTAKHIIDIGTAGGMTKASSGYTFQNIQHHNTLIIKDLKQCRPLKNRRISPWRFKLYDKILLDVLVNHRYPGENIFKALFSKNKANRVLSFLGEKSRIWDEIIIIASLPKKPFAKALLNLIRH